MNVASAFLIVGLGNPGAKYAMTRHNAGFMVADELARRYGISFDKHTTLYDGGQGVIEGKQVMILKPLTYMNLSGKAVQSALTKYGFQRQRLLVFVDDCRLPMGKVRLRPNGGAGGHNGLTNIIDLLGTKDFARIRLGLGAPPEGDPIDFVLGSFLPSEREALAEMVQVGADCAVDFLKEGAELAMSNFNGR